MCEPLKFFKCKSLHASCFGLEIKKLLVRLRRVVVSQLLVHGWVSVKLIVSAVLAEASYANISAAQPRARPLALARAPARPDGMNIIKVHRDKE